MGCKVQLFCVGYAGGTAEAFLQLEQLLEADRDKIEVIALEYAGHGARRSEPFYDNFDQMAQDISAQISRQRRMEVPYALLGYSMGSLVVYEAVCRWRRKDCPKHIFLAAHEAPDVEEKYQEFKMLAQLPDAEFMQQMAGLGGFEKYDPTLLKNRFFCRMFVRPLRKDYEYLAYYQIRDNRMFPAKVTVFYAPADTPEDRIHSWDRFSDQEIEYIPMGHTHFFIKGHAGEMADVISEKLLS